jgi:hypothetical protein
MIVVGLALTNCDASLELPTKRTASSAASPASLTGFETASMLPEDKLTSSSGVRSASSLNGDAVQKEIEQVAGTLR